MHPVGGQVALRDIGEGEEILVDYNGARVVKQCARPSLFVTRLFRHRLQRLRRTR